MTYMLLREAGDLGLLDHLLLLPGLGLGHGVFRRFGGRPRLTHGELDGLDGRFQGVTVKNGVILVNIWLLTDTERKL